MLCRKITGYHKKQRNPTTSQHILDIYEFLFEILLAGICSMINAKTGQTLDYIY